jgi:CobQ-like glutamine amidotransferase family enzyme
MDLTIAWLYGAKMNIYGDRGNVVALAQRARWRDVEVRVLDVGIGDPLPPADLFFFGGGQDQEQIAVAKDLRGAKGEALKAEVDDGAALLAVCGGYQLLGHEYRPHDAEPLPGIGLFDLVTEAGSERFIGNVVVDTAYGTVVGFENHSGLTHLGPNTQPLGTVRVGRGNNGRDGTEGALHKSAIGCYLHGSVLPKNPALADWLLGAGLRRRHGDVDLQPLPDDLEHAAHQSALDRAVRTR